MSKYEVRHEHSYLDMESKYRLFNKDGCELDLHDCCDVLSRKDIRIAELEKEISSLKNFVSLQSTVIAESDIEIEKLEKDCSEWKYLFYISTNEE